MNLASTNRDALENLSAGIDGELSREELRFLMRRLDHDDALCGSWHRYHVVRDGLRRNLPSLATTGFAARVMLAIEQETVQVQGRRHHRWLRWSAGGAIAAGVAVAALMITQPTGDAERVAPLTAQTTPGMTVQSKSMPSPAEPAAVPPWLSGKAPGMLSQQAAVTLGAPTDTGFSAYGGDTSPFGLQHYRTLDNHDGSYLILLDPAQQQGSDYPRQATDRAQ